MPAPDLADALLAADAAERERLLHDAATDDLTAAITTLGHRHLQDAADVLALVESSVDDRAVRKAARRELHRLRSAGVHAHAPVEPAIALAAVPVSATRAEPVVPIAEAWATDIDSTGSRALWLLGVRPLGGAWFGALLTNELQGLIELSLVDTTRKRFHGELEERRRTPGSWVALPGDYALRLVKEAVDVGRAAGTPLPTRYHALREAFGEADGPPERALVYETISPVEASLSPELLEESQALMHEAEVQGWSATIPEPLRARALEVARANNSALLVPGHTPPQQALQLLADAAQQALTPAVRHGLRRRLEETAYIFVTTERVLAARRAVAAAQ